MSVPDGRHRYPVANNRQRLISVEGGQVQEAFTQYSNGKIQEVPATERSQLLDELESQRRKGGRK